MKFTLPLLLLFLASLPAPAQDAGLSDTLTIEETSLGGFVGHLATTTTISKSGAWTMNRVIGRSPRGSKEGTLSADELAQIAAVLKEQNFADLPELVGPAPKPPRNNAAANVTTITLGEKKVVLSGNSESKPPAPDSEAGKQSQRIRALVDAVRKVTYAKPAAPM